MKKWIVLTMAGAMLLGGSMAYAGGGCCEGVAAKADKAMGCSKDTLSKLNLTDDQKTKLAALKTECTKDGCTPEAREAFNKGMKEILTADQFTQWETECKKVSKGSCPMKKEESKI